MTAPRRIILSATVLLALCLAVGTAWVKWRQSRSFFDTSVLLSRFPAEEAAVMRIDFAALRSGGFLSPSKLPLEPEYKQFLDGTGLDYRRDLDTVVASFSNSGNFFIARGRFDWTKLRAYALQQGGSCYEQLCRMQGSTPQRHISFLPLRDDAIALAVSTDDLAASRLTKSGQPVNGQFPNAPAWLSIPGAALRQQGVMPAGMRVVFSGLTNADRVVVTLNAAATGVEAHLEATCRSQDDARILASQLRSTTGLLKETLARDAQARTDALALMLVAGSFDQADRRVTGTWPVGKALLESLTNGI